jgi:argininosuccinate synthase
MTSCLPQGCREWRRRESPKSLYSSTLVTFEDDKGAYDQKDAQGFIKLNALRLRTFGMRDRPR